MYEILKINLIELLIALTWNNFLNEMHDLVLFFNLNVTNLLIFCEKLKIL